MVDGHVTTGPWACVLFSLRGSEDAGGAGDPTLDDYAAKQKPEVRSAAEAAAKPWLASLQKPAP